MLFHRILLGEVLDFVVASLNVNVGPYDFQQFHRSVFLENDHRVDAAQGGQKARSVLLRVYRTGGSFETLHGGVGINTHDQLGAFGGGSSQCLDVTYVKNIEAAVGEDDGFAGLSPSLSLRGDLVSRQDDH